MARLDNQHITHLKGVCPNQKVFFHLGQKCMLSRHGLIKQHHTHHGWLVREGALADDDATPELPPGGGPI